MVGVKWCDINTRIKTPNGVDTKHTQQRDDQWQIGICNVEIATDGPWSGHICLRVAILIQGNSVPYFETRSGMGCRWLPVSLPCVSGWVAFGNPLVEGHGSVTWTKGEDGRAGPQ